jgi:hypothetical protein
MIVSAWKDTHIQHDDDMCCCRRKNRDFYDDF